ncbi:TRAP transporter small permease [Salinibacterium sp. ZJ77]|uniref:TRAP transporter small permease subunit n=1 Tax=Salinibacterium sp. ZJ77 TaxID=2708337 RepID=UPI001423A075|nr:TRAP transporter small permease [Salinibacterium sp. ZJ77]
MSTRLSQTATARKLLELPGRMARLLAVVAATFTVIAALLLTAEVLSRAFLNQPVRGLFEYMQILVVLIAFLGLAEAERHGDHIRVTLLTERMPLVPRLAARTIAMILSALIVLWMTVMSWIELTKSLNRGEFQAGLLNLPVWPARTIIVIGLAALFLMYVVRTAETAIELKNSFAGRVDADADQDAEGGDK